MSDTPSSANAIAFTEISKQTFSGLEKPENVFIDNTEDWARFWRRANSGTTPMPESPGIDFSKTIVIATCMGIKNSGGYQTEIVGTKVAGETVYVSIENTSPGTGCMATMAITYPYHVIQIEKGSINNAVFSIEEIVDDCK